MSKDLGSELFVCVCVTDLISEEEKRKVEFCLKNNCSAAEQSYALQIHFVFSDALLFIRLGVAYQSEIVCAYKYISLSGQSRRTARGAS